MHKIYTVVLRLFVDSDTPENIKGSLQLSPKKQALLFTDGQALLDLLSQILMQEECDSTSPSANSIRGKSGSVD